MGGRVEVGGKEDGKEGGREGEGWREGRRKMNLQGFYFSPTSHTTYLILYHT